MQDLEPETTQQIIGMAIAVKKKEMIDLGMTYGLTDTRTIQCSQHLDGLLNLYTDKHSLELTG
ncbi:aspartyl-phosphate phosphatase Spo0E family protein [Lentibacillus amyloliquefaciens]|uniref:Aspartyl-phosphate phosphatase Spo0E family protein n=1 Tax=Lentibacillus amyloliquefaciens TaxID=1472767 RepID=A0A0U4E7N6_9BACI|nr:aspartyl-phosphate phosphatase Spo0E family protein [Lentibacillus amyloliquefaciens]ALX48865.1 hypothetical protein AOX59_09710 [Lentibacillus amyloliquefaciens]